MATYGGVVLILWLAGIAIAILWIALPFAVFGIKWRLDRQHLTSEKVLAELEAIRQLLEEQRAGAAPDLPVREGFKA